VTSAASPTATSSPPTTAPPPSSGPPADGRLSQRGNRRLNHAVHLAAVGQIRQRHSDGRAYFDRKLAEGKTKKEAPRALKRHVSNAVHRQLLMTPTAPVDERVREDKQERLCCPA
jgi:transposase